MPEPVWEPHISIEALYIRRGYCHCSGTHSLAIAKGSAHYVRATKAEVTQQQHFKWGNASGPGAFIFL